VIRCLFDYRKVLYRGLAKDSAQLFLRLAFANLLTHSEGWRWHSRLYVGAAFSDAGLDAEKRVET
jgi:hypothetical protein